MRVLLLVAVVVLSILWSAGSLAGAEDNRCNLYFVVYGDPRCPHCKALLAVLERAYPGCYEFRNIAVDVEARQQYVSLWDEVVGRGGYAIPFTVLEVNGTPRAFIVGELDLQGLERVVDQVLNATQPLLCLGDRCRPVVSTKGVRLAIPSDKLALAATLVGLAALDAINPCFLALYAALVAAATLRGRGLAAGLATTLGVFIGYFGLGLGLVGLLAAVGQAVRPLMGLAATVLGVNMVVGSRGNRECKICMKVSQLASAGPATWFGFGLLASLTLLPCTAGPYVVAIALLHGLPLAEKLGYLILYNSVFVAPLLAICAGAARIVNMVSQHRRALELVLGLLLIGLGAAILLGIV
jgi:cytochrome c biogenesis protein CcdA/glutaredoxin